MRTVIQKSSKIILLLSRFSLSFSINIYAPHHNLNLYLHLDRIMRVIVENSLHIQAVPPKYPGEGFLIRALFLLMCNFSIPPSQAIIKRDFHLFDWGVIFHVACSPTLYIYIRLLSAYLYLLQVSWVSNCRIHNICEDWWNFGIVNFGWICLCDILIVFSLLWRICLLVAYDNPPHPLAISYSYKPRDNKSQRKSVVQ